MKSLPIGLVLVLLGGCAWRNCLSCCSSWRQTPQVDCRQVEPAEVVPDISLLPPTSSGEAISYKYCAISESTAQCLAARNSRTANLLTKEAEAIEAQPHCGHDGSELAQDLLLLQATQKRNEDAAAALEILLRLAEAEGGAQSLAQRLVQVDGMLSDVSRLQEQGVASPVTRNDVELQRMELLHRQADLQGTIHTLNHQLAEAMGVELPPGSHYWPEAPLLVEPELPDEEAAVQFAMNHRADLTALRLAARADGREALAAAKIILQPLGMGGSASGSSHGLGKLLLLCAQHGEADVRSEQLRLAYREQQRTVEHEVRQAVGLVATRVVQSSLTRDRQQVAKSKLLSAERQQELTVGAQPDIRTIRLEGLAVDQDLLHDAVEWKIAAMKLRAAQGMLAIECGWNAAIECR